MDAAIFLKDENNALQLQCNEVQESYDRLRAHCLSPIANSCARASNPRLAKENKDFLAELFHRNESLRREHSNIKNKYQNALGSIGKLRKEVRSLNLRGYRGQRPTNRSPSVPYETPKNFQNSRAKVNAEVAALQQRLAKTQHEVRAGSDQEYVLMTQTLHETKARLCLCLEMLKEATNKLEKSKIELRQFRSERDRNRGLSDQLACSVTEVVELPRRNQTLEERIAILCVEDSLSQNSLRPDDSSTSNVPGLPINGGKDESANQADDYDCRYDDDDFDLEGHSEAVDTQSMSSLSEGVK